MQHDTRPRATPKSPFACRAEALDDAELFDLNEFPVWAERTDALGLRWTLSRRLLERVEDIPFRARTSAEERLRSLRARAEDALQRAAEHFGAHFTGALGFGFTVDFAAALPRSATDRPWHSVRMHCGPDESGTVCVTLLEPEEFSAEREMAAATGTGRNRAPARWMAAPREHL
jgi:hypothetical protein